MDDRRILHDAPLPLARGYRRCLNASGPRDRHDAAFYLFEIYLKYSASIAVAGYLALEERDHRVNAALKGLARPSLGEWLRFLRECLAFLSRREKPDPVIQAAAKLFEAREGRWKEVLALQNALVAFRQKDPGQKNPGLKEKVSLEQLLGEIVAYRNAVVGHGAPLDGAHYEKFADLFARAFGELLEESPFIFARRLVAFDGVRIRSDPGGGGSKVEYSIIEFMGDNPLRAQAPLVLDYGAKVPREKALHLLGEDGSFISLDPLLISHRDDVYVLNEAQGSPEYLSYSTGERHRPSGIGEAEGKLFERILGYRVDEGRLSRIGDDVAPILTPGAAAAATDATSTTPATDAETKLGDYRILREMGRGAMGIVFEAVQESLGRRVALKVLPGTFALDPRRVERFRREARATARIHHPSIVPVYEVGESQATHYYAMEFIDGPPLDKLIARAREDAAAKAREATPKGRRGSASSSTADPAYIAHAVEQLALVAEGLHEAHKLGLIHRDVKPSNLLTDSGGRYVLVDFGLVHEAEARTLTRSGELVGTLHYMSPEQVSRGQVDARSDVYSLGATLYEILTLHPPFERATEHDAQRAILFEEPVAPRKLNPKLNRDLETIILHALEKNPEKRYATASELAGDLRRFIRYEPIRARPPSFVSRFARRAARHRGKVAATAALTVLALAVAWFAIESRREAGLRREAAYGPTVLAAVLKLEMAPLARRAKAGETTRFDPARTGITPEEFQALLRDVGIDPVEGAVHDLAVAAAAAPSRPDAHYHRARGLVYLSRDDEALAALDEALKALKDFVPARFLRAQILDKKGDKDGAAKERQRAESMAAAGGWAKAWLQGSRAVREEQWKDAVEAYGKLIDLEQSGHEPYLGAAVEARFARGAARLELKDHLGAYGDFIIVESLWPDALEPALLRGFAQHLMGSAKEANVTFEALYQKAPVPDEVVLGVASLYLAAYEHDRALEWLKKLSIAPAKERIRAGVLKSLGRNEEALVAAREALRLSLDDPRAAYAVSYILSQGLGRNAEAAEVAKEALKSHPDDIDLLIGLGDALLRDTKFAEAEVPIRKAIELRPKQGGNCGLLGVILSPQGKFTESFEMHEKSLQLSPKDPNNYHLFGSSLGKAGRLEEAVRVFDKGIAIDPKFSWNHSRKGTTLDRLGRLTDAIDAYRRACEGYPKDGQDQRKLGELLLRKGHTQEAFQAFSRAIEIKIGQLDAHEHLWRLIQREEKPEGWAPVLERLLPTLEKAVIGKERLPHALNTLALIRLRAPTSKDLPAALTHAEEAVKTSRRGWPYLWTLGEALFETGKQREAILTLEEAVRQPNAPRALLEELFIFRKTLSPTIAPFVSLDDALGPLRAVSDLEQKLREAYLSAPTAEGHEKVLRKALEGNHATDRALWNDWTGLCFVALHRSPANILADFPSAPPSDTPERSPEASREATHPRDEIRHLLNQIDVGGAIRIKCGDVECRGSSGPFWESDRFFLGGQLMASEWIEARHGGPHSGDILKTDDDALYRKGRWFPADAIESGYRIPLPPCLYRVTLHFCERWWQARGMRVFDVLMEGKTILAKYEPLAAGYATADLQSFEIPVTDGLLDIDFVAYADVAEIYAIEIQPLR